MTSTRMATLAASAFLAMTLNASAEPAAYAFDPLHTEVRFCWNHLGVSRQCANLLKYDGALRYDEANPENSTLQVTFKTDSIETRAAIFNEHIKGEKFFDVAKYPDATFKSTKFEKTGERSGKVTGDLTIHGNTKPVTLDVTLNFAGPHPMSKKPTLGIGAATTIKRTEFGVGAYAPAVSDEVSIEIQTELNKKG